MWSHKPVEPLSANFRNEIGLVSGDVSREVVITGGALFVAIVLIEPQLWISANSAKVSGVVLPIMKTPTTDT
jgi:hypothetical protein